MDRFCLISIDISAKYSFYQEGEYAHYLPVSLCGVNHLENIPRSVQQLHFTEGMRGDIRGVVRSCGEIEILMILQSLMFRLLCLIFLFPSPTFILDKITTKISTTYLQQSRHYLLILTLHPASPNFLLP